ncbi:hypothetical protein [Streptomyces chartreusis]|uniref:hypothetical protein n=1 Tax=Streptomyces chartreusis TaxID=1969 RepID=UPI00367665AA
MTTYTITTLKPAISNLLKQNQTQSFTVAEIATLLNVSTAQKMVLGAAITALTDEKVLRKREQNNPLANSSTLKLQYDVEAQRAQAAAELMYPPAYRSQASPPPSYQPSTSQSSSSARRP